MALNVALYGADGRRWTMTERSARALKRDTSSLVIGPSRIVRRGRTLTMEIDEVTVPWPSRVRGTVRLTTDAWLDADYPLDAAGRHLWQPLAPRARIEVDLDRPASRWQGTAYIDSNRGSAPLEQDFVRWHWSRGHDEAGSTRVLYDAERRDGSALSLALGFGPGEAPKRLAAAAQAELPRTAWGIERTTRADAGAPATVVETLESGPFYARSLIRSSVEGDAMTSVHESLDLDRFASPWVQAMLPFRMPRRA